MMDLAGTLKLPDINGESKLKNHEDEIDFFGCSWQMLQRSSASLGSGLTSARAEVWPIRIEKWYDAASPYLALLAMNGKTMDEAVLTLRKDSGDDAIDYLIITMTNVIISSYEIGEAVAGENKLERVPERIGLSFEKVKVLYTMQNSDGTAGDEHEIEYSIVEGA